MTYQEIFNEIKNKAYFKNHRHVLIAVSGGVDSMNLLHFLYLFQDKLKIVLVLLMLITNKDQNQIQKKLI